MALPFDLHTYAALARESGDASDERFSHTIDGRGRRSPSILLPSDLVRRVRDRDVEAFRELVRSTYGPLVQFGRSILGGQDDAEDVVQDVFTVVWELGAVWSPKGDPVAYLFASVRNSALNELRRRSRAKARIEKAGPLDADIPGSQAEYTPASALDALVDAETDTARMRRVAAVLATCTEVQRTAYELRFRRGLTIPAIAEILGVTVKSAEHLTARVARFVLDRLKEEGTGG